ncbi:hypothetical protein NLJ89_g6219 [Agrocybe chaxingu]|uniref:Uncharacterized protein n=1 Tax=Agrocybe chaxingu TaxID=84603 RepID=A0A9W8MSW7_9AGAR|nr:hypothetical protein NLJ89_g6219 [Agrocybe chaxingu]
MITCNLIGGIDRYSLHQRERLRGHEYALLPTQRDYKSRIFGAAFLDDRTVLAGHNEGYIAIIVDKGVNVVGPDRYRISYFKLHSANEPTSIVITGVVQGKPVVFAVGGQGPNSQIFMIEVLYPRPPTTREALYPVVESGEKSEVEALRDLGKKLTGDIEKLVSKKASPSSEDEKPVRGPAKSKGKEEEEEEESGNLRAPLATPNFNALTLAFLGGAALLFGYYRLSVELQGLLQSGIDQSNAIRDASEAMREIAGSLRKDSKAVQDLLNKVAEGTPASHPQVFQGHIADVPDTESLDTGLD